MKSVLLIPLLLLSTLVAHAQSHRVSGPDGKLILEVSIEEGGPHYAVSYAGKTMLEKSPLGLRTNHGVFDKELKIVGIREGRIDRHYNQDRIKRSVIHQLANQWTVALENPEGQKMELEVQVSNHDIGLRYRVHPDGDTAVCTIEKEYTGFRLPAHATTFLSAQATPMIGWQRTKPSYEEGYTYDEPVGTASRYGLGYTFPALFRIGDDGWVLLSETGVSSAYCGSRLGEAAVDGLYSIAFPEPGENNGIGSAHPSIDLPGWTPWRTITVGDTLKPIVETTITWDLVEPLYEPSQDYRFGRSTWSWIMWQDPSMNWDDQITYIDLAATMGWEYILVDAMWDEAIGYERMPTLVDYARSKGVELFLWYNSNGYWNDAPQGPRHKMNTAIARNKEMQWMQNLGVKGIKVDFFGGDKQETIRLYEDILADANRHGLMVIFHGCTLPRGWERMYPNFVGSEAVLASENLIFGQWANDMEATHASLHPFLRNAVASMEFGPVLLNKRHNRTNDGGTIRRTSETFQLATAILFQNSVQMFALAPNNLEELPAFVIDFMKTVPTTWDETRYVAGYPGKYAVVARRHGDRWFVVGVNAKQETLELELELPMFAGLQVVHYADDADLTSTMNPLVIPGSGMVSVTLRPNGGLILGQK